MNSTPDSLLDRLRHPGEHGDGVGEIVLLRKAQDHERPDVALGWCGTMTGGGGTCPYRQTGNVVTLGGMNITRITLKSRVGSDGVLHLHLPVGQAEADRDVQITVESIAPVTAAKPPTLTASDLLHSGLVGIWAQRTDIGDSRAFARRLREEAQTRSHSQ